MRRGGVKPISAIIDRLVDKLLEREAPGGAEGGPLPPSASPRAGDNPEPDAKGNG
jgi:hypothetical protein